MKFLCDLGVGAKVFDGKVHRPQNCAFSDIFGQDLTRHTVAFCMGIAICHRRKFGQSPVPEGTHLYLRLPHGKIGIILRCNRCAVG